jgi:hypothetical protein
MWINFAALSGGASAGLTGLTFIVVAFRFDTLAVSEEYRSRAAQTLSLFLTVAVLSALVAVPQPTQAVGVEMVVTAVASAASLASLDQAARRRQKDRPRIGLTIGLTLFVACTMTGGVLLVAGFEWGMYFFVASSILALVLGVNGAWIYLTRVDAHPTT